MYFLEGAHRNTILNHPLAETALVLRIVTDKTFVNKLDRTKEVVEK